MPSPHGSSSLADTGDSTLSPTASWTRTDPPVRRLPRLPAPLADRSRLHERLDAHRPLTVIRAPAGFGRTTLINSWLADRSESVADVVVRVTARGKPDRLWTRLAHDLHAVGLGHTAPPTTSAELWVRQTLSSSDHDVLVVVDDLDRLEPAIDEALLDLVRHSDRLRLVLGLGDADRLAMIRWPDLDVDELTAVDLAFTAAEAWTFADGLHRDLSRELTESVNSELGGWPAPTVAVLRVLAAMPVGSRTSSAAGRAVHDHLVSLLGSASLPEEPTPSLLSLAIPGHLTPQIVAAMDDAGATRSFASMVSLGLVRSRDRDGEQQHHWPPAVRRLLAARMEKAHPELARTLHQRLRRHFARDLPAEELRHAAAAKDWGGVVTAVDRSWGMLFTADRSLLRSSLLGVPLDLLRSHPRVEATRALVLGLPDAQLLSMVHRQLRNGEDSSHDDVETDLTLMVSARVRGLWPEARRLADRITNATIHAQRNGDAATARRLSVRMLQVGITRVLADDLPGSVDPMRLAHREAGSSDRTYVAADAAAKLACVMAVRGDLHGAAHWLADHRQQEAAYGWITPLVEAPALVAQILIASASTNPATAEGAVSTLLGIQVPQEFWAFRAFALARFALATGSPQWGWQRLTEARVMSERPESVIQSSAGGISQPMMTAAEANALIALGRGNQARVLLETAGEHVMLWAPRARLSLLGGDPVGARGWADRGLADAATPPAELTELFAIRSIASLRADDVTGAIADMRQAVSLIRLNGTPAVLRAVPRDETVALLPDVVGLGELLSSEPSTSVVNMYPSSLELVSLTARESLLLRMLDTGDTLQAISTALFVSINTVKSQRRSLYQKLGAGSRGEALARARDFGLLDQPAIGVTPVSM